MTTWVAQYGVTDGRPREALERTIASPLSRTGRGRIWVLLLEPKEEIPDMALLDSIVDENFRNEPSGRVVIFSGTRRHRGYLVKSAAEELKIRSFLEMFHLAQLSILLLGYLLAFEWSRELSYALDIQSALLLRVGLSLGFFFLVAGIPYWLLWKCYKKAFLSFVSVEDETVLLGKSAGWRNWRVSAGLMALAILLLLGAALLVRSASVSN